jgi:maltose alpha-D-glucosyltransferase / alpha-amylase
LIEDLWYKNAIIYSLDLETFMDSNGDGVGDFEGLVRRLDYLETLGVDVIWIAPFQPSPNRDNGYDISDYYGVDQRYGSSGSFVEFVHQAKKRGIKVIIDLVVNHTSDQHRWFQQSRSDPASRFRNWYVWSEKRPETWNEGMVFPGVQKSTWTRDSKAGAYYYHRFYEHQPDLNMDNPEVRTEIRRVIGFWLQLGVDGFRVDAVPFLIETPPRKKGKKPEMNFEYLEEFRAFLQWRMGDAIFLGEANVEPKEVEPYFAEGRGIQMMFNFWVNQHLFHSLATGEVSLLVKALEDTREIPPTAQWAQFLRNHDELDLGRLTDEQREAVFRRFGPDESMRLYDRGIRRRLGPMLGSRQQNELAYSLLFSLPGTPVIRYGDEIGMGENLELNERDAVRTPMQWTDQKQAGFSSADKLVHPVIDEGYFGYEHVNVEKQRREPDSMLQWMGKMIRLRKECLEIGWGEFQVVNSGSPHILILTFAWRGTAIVTVHNLDGAPHEIEFKLPLDDADCLYNLMADEESIARENGKHHLAIEGFGYRWYRAADLNYALRRTSEEPQESRKKKQTGKKKSSR